MTDGKGSAMEPFEKASPQLQKIIKKVLQLEKDKLSQPKPRGINADVINIIKEEVV